MMLRTHFRRLTQNSCKLVRNTPRWVKCFVAGCC